MRCKNCIHYGECLLQEITSELIGCEGPSQMRELKEDEVLCISCDKIVKKDKAFGDTCFKCY